MKSIDRKFDEINKAILKAYDDIRSDKDFDIHIIDKLVTELGELFVGVPLDQAMNYKDQFITTSLKIKALRKIIAAEMEATAVEIKKVDQSKKVQEAYSNVANDNPNK